MKNLIFYFLSLVLTVSFLGSCNQIDENPRALVNLILVDTPAKWDSVLVEIQGVEVEMLLEGRETDRQSFYLEYETGDKKIRVSDLVAGSALIIGRDELPVGKIIGLKVRMGDSHSLYQRETRYQLPLLNPSEVSISLPMDLDLQPGLAFDIILDMDLESSILQTSSNPLNFKLDPVFKVIDGGNAGEIKGTISPATLKPAIYLIQGSDSISTHANSSGTYLFRVPSGTYSLFFDPKDNTYSSKSLPGIEVQTARTTQVELVTITKKP